MIGYYALEEISSSVVHSKIPVNFTRYTNTHVDWNNVSADPRVTGMKVSSLTDEDSVSHSYELWVDTAFSHDFVSGGYTYAGWPSDVSARQWGGTATWKISLRNLPVNTDFELEIYASNQSYHNDYVDYLINGVTTRYNSIDTSGHALFVVTTTSDSSGVISIEASGSTHIPISAMKFRQL